MGVPLHQSPVLDAVVMIPEETFAQFSWKTRGGSFKIFTRAQVGTNGMIDDSKIVASSEGKTWE